MNIRDLIDILQPFPSNYTVGTTRKDGHDDLAIWDENGKMVKEIDLEDWHNRSPE